MSEINEIIKELNKNKTITEQCADIWLLGNRGSEADKAASKLIKILHQNPNWRVRSWIVWSLGRIGGRKSRKALEKTIKKDEEEFIRDGASYALEKLEIREEFIKNHDSIPSTGD